MPVLFQKNQFGAAGGFDVLRADLWYLQLSIPKMLTQNNWDDTVGFAVEKVTLPDRGVEMIPIKYLQQTNHLIGADTAAGAIDIPVRYTFNEPTAQVLERWSWLMSDPRTGGVALTSQVKSNGYLFWMLPNMSAQADNVNNNADNPTFTIQEAYYLEGCLVKGLKPSALDQTSNNGLVTLDFTIQIDRYYPRDPANLQLNTNNVVGSPNNTTPQLQVPTV